MQMQRHVMMREGLFEGTKITELYLKIRNKQLIGQNGDPNESLVIAA